MNQDCSACHRCPLLCYEKCKPCSKSVTKMQACGHWSRMLCSTNPLSMPCQQDCFRTLKCGHKCNRLCRGPCGPCSIMVRLLETLLSTISLIKTNQKSCTMYYVTVKLDINRNYSLSFYLFIFILFVCNTLVNIIHMTN